MDPSGHGYNFPLRDALLSAEAEVLECGLVPHVGKVAGRKPDGGQIFAQV